MNTCPRNILIIGGILIVVGFIWQLSYHLIPLEKLPGDINIRSGKVNIFIPITTSIILSIVASELLYMFTQARSNVYIDIR